MRGYVVVVVVHVVIMYISMYIHPWIDRMGQCGLEAPEVHKSRIGSENSL